MALLFSNFFLTKKYYYSLFSYFIILHIYYSIIYFILYFIIHFILFDHNEHVIEKFENVSLILKKKIRLSYNYFFHAYTEIIIKQYYTFNTLIICSSASLYRQVLRNRVPWIKGSSYWRIYYRGKEAFYERLLFIGTRNSTTLSCALPFSLSVGENFRVRSLNSALIQSKRILKASSVAQDAKTERKRVFWNVSGWTFIPFGRTLNYASDVTPS